MPFAELKVDINAMQQFAAQVAAQTRTRDCLTLRGEVGAGKTTFARAYIQAIATGKTEVTSPTFNLMQSYDVRTADGQLQTLWHADLYRLKEVDEVNALGLEELENNIILIEWPEIIENRLSPERLDIYIDCSDEHIRIVKLVGNDAWRERLHAICKMHAQ